MDRYLDRQTDQQIKRAAIDNLKGACLCIIVEFVFLKYYKKNNDTF